MFLKISFHTFFTWAVLAHVFLAGFVMGDRYGDTWNGPQFMLAMLHVCGVAYAVVWMENISMDPSLKEQYKTFVTGLAAAVAVATAITLGGLVFLIERYPSLEKSHGWWLAGAFTLYVLIAFAIFRAKTRKRVVKGPGFRMSDPQLPADSRHRLDPPV